MTRTITDDVDRMLEPLILAMREAAADALFWTLDERHLALDAVQAYPVLLHWEQGLAVEIKLYVTHTNEEAVPGDG